MAPRPLLLEVTKPSSRICRNTKRIISRLIPGQSDSIDTIVNGPILRLIVLRINSVFDPLLVVITPTRFSNSL